MDNKLLLEQLRIDMENDKSLPLVSKSTDVIPGDGNPNSTIVLIGEAGGYNESVQRRPFVGQAGQLLNKLLILAGIRREDVYITNMVKTRPPNNRDPLPEELKAYEYYLDRELDIIQPKLVITLGRFSMAKFLPGVFISSVHGKKYEAKFKNRKIIIVPMYHPAASLRNGNVLNQEKNDFLKLKSMLPGILNKKEDVKDDKVEVEQISLL